MAYNTTNLAVAPTQAQTYNVIQQNRLPGLPLWRLLDEFIDYVDRKETTTKGYTSCLNQFFYWLEDIGIFYYDQVDRNLIKEYRDHLASDGFAATTQDQYLRAVKQFAKWASAKYHLPNIIDNIHGAKVRHDIFRRDCFTPEEVEMILPTIDRSDEEGKRLYAMFLLVFVNNMRRIEVSRANVGDLKTLCGNRCLFIQPKGHDEKDKPAFLGWRTKEAIEDYLKHRTTKVTPKSPLFTARGNRNKDGRLSTSSITRMFKKCYINAGFDSDRLTTHSGRHTAATTAMQQGADIFETQTLLGHQSPSTTEMYTHMTNQYDIEKKYRQRIEDAYFNSGNKLTPIVPELEDKIMTLSKEEQYALLAQLNATKETLSHITRIN